MKSSQVTLLSDCLNISGEYYTVSSGFISRVHGEIRLKYKDLLTVEFVKHRSKKLMYAALFLGAILAFVSKLNKVIPITLFITILTIIVCAAGITYLVSRQRFVEITSMCGTYRVAVGREDSEMENVVMRLKKQIFK